MPRCITCQILDVASEPALHRLVREQERQIDALSQRLMDANVEGVPALQARVAELEQIVAAQNRRLAQRRGA